MENWLSDLLPEGTPAGQARAVTRDDDLITVGAGAGTGKTWVLSARFARLLLSDRTCLPQNILTLTFTEAAAREMQERIRRRVFSAFEAAALRSGDEDRKNERKNEWQAVKDGFDEVWISTIHSFASRLIRESGLSLDIDPRSGVVSAPQEEAFWGSLERALESLDLVSLAAPFGNEILRETASLLETDAPLIAALEKWGPSVLRDLSRGVTELHASLGHSWETLTSWANEADRAAAALQLDPQAKIMSDAVLELLRPRWAEAWELWRMIFADLNLAIFEARDKALEKINAKRTNPAIPLAEVAEDWRGPFEALETLNILKDENETPPAELQRAFYLDICSKLSGDNSKLFKAIGEYLGQTASKWRDSQADWLALSLSPPHAPLSEAEQRLRASLLRLSAFAWVAWDETKRRRNLLSFSDMIHFAAQSIRHDTRTKGFKHVLIDEFQDTDPLQDEMIRTLREKEETENQRPKLFLVGDPKQAIYRFRHADLTLFADYVLQSRAADSDITLDVSFRTREALLAPINSLFAHVWKDGLGVGSRMESLKFEPLNTPEWDNASEREGGTTSPFTLLLSVKKGRGDDARDRLDRSLARTFARWVGSRTVWDKNERRLRPAQWKDFAILTPTRSEYEALEAAFEEEGVPVVFKKSMSYFSRGEVVDVINTLRAAAFSNDETALAGWLASPLSGVSQREASECLKAHSSASTTASLYDVLREHLPAAAERLAYLRRLGSLKGPSALLSHLLEDRTWLGAFDAAQRPRVIGNVNRAIAIARQYESGVFPSLAGCAQWLDTALRAERATEEPDWMDEDANAVRVMTVHASKGLEFPVVAVMRTERGVRGRFPSTVAASKMLGVAFSDIPDMMKPNGQEEDNEDEKNEEKPRSLKWERALSAQAELEESTRLFYVAATRAQDALILCGLVGEDVNGERSVKKDSWLSWTLDWLAKERDCDWRDLDGPPIVWASNPKAERPLIEEQPSEPTEARKPLEIYELFPKPLGLPLDLPPTEDLTLLNFSATSFALFEWCPFAWRRRHRQGLDLRWEVPDDADSVGGSELGSLAHWILARWNMKEETLGSWLEEAAVARRLPTALRDTWRSVKNREVLRSWLSAFSRSGEGRVLASAVRDGALYCENAFCATLDAGTRLVGATDALWRDEGQWHVRDYKITLSDNAPVELYRAQLAFYALVVKLLAERRGLPFRGVDVGLIFLREGGRLDDTRSFRRDGNWTTIQEEITAAARAAVQGPWAPRREHCRRCPWRGKCPKRKGACHK